MAKAAGDNSLQGGGHARATKPWWWMPWWPISVKAEPTLRGLRVVKGGGRAAELIGCVLPWERVGRIPKDSQSIGRIRFDEESCNELALINPPKHVSISIPGGKRPRLLAKRLQARRLRAIARGEPFVAHGHDVNRWDLWVAILILPSMVVLVTGVLINRLMVQGMPQLGPQPWWGWVMLGLVVLFFLLLSSSPAFILICFRPAKRGMKKVRLDEHGLELVTIHGQARTYRWDTLLQANVIRHRRLVELHFGDGEPVRFSTDLHILSLCTVVADARLGTHLKTKGRRTPTMARRMAWRMIAYGVIAAVFADLAILSMGNIGLQQSIAPGLRPLLYVFFIGFPGMIAFMALREARELERALKSARSV